MAKHGKRYIEAAKLIDPEKLYTPAEAAALLKKTATAKFDQTIEVHIRLGVDPRQSDEMVRGTIGLPHGTGKKLRIVVFAQGDKAAEATKAGADVVGAADLVAKIDGGWMEFDIVIATRWAFIRPPTAMATPTSPSINPAIRFTSNRSIPSASAIGSGLIVGASVSGWPGMGGRPSCR